MLYASHQTSFSDISQDEQKYLGLACIYQELSIPGLRPQVDGNSLGNCNPGTLSRPAEPYAHSCISIATPIRSWRWWLVFLTPRNAYHCFVLGIILTDQSHFVRLEPRGSAFHALLRRLLMASPQPHCHLLEFCHRCHCSAASEWCIGH
jgi:hypothetical protein